MTAFHLPPAEVTTLATLISTRAAHCPQQSAFIELGEHYSFATIEQRAEHLADVLAARGLKPDDRLVLVSKDCLQSYLLLFACAKLGVVLVPVNWRLTATEIGYIIDDSQAALVVYHSEFSDVITPLTTTKNVALNAIDLGVAVAARAPHQVNSEDVAVQLYTSGTTGRPKGVLLAHRTFFDLPQYMSSQGDLWMNIEQHDVLMLTLPMFHIGGLWWAIQGMRQGATGVIEAMFVPWRILELIESHAITLLCAVPAMLHACLSEPDCDDTDLSSVRAILYGGSPISAALLNKAMLHFDAEYYQIYGLTETGNMAVCLRPSDHMRSPQRQDIPALDRVGIAGKPLPGVELQIRQPDNGELCASAQVGEIYIKTPSVMVGYWNNAPATEQALVDGWLRTGDAGYIDADGYLCVCDRIKDMIIRAGENLYPAEIEAALSGHPDISEVAVIGVPHDTWGEAVMALIVPKEQQSREKLSLSQLQGFLRANLAAHKHPNHIEWQDTLPRNASGKILKHQLRAPFWQDAARNVN